MLRDELLVRAHDVAPFAQRTQDIVARRIGTADQLDDDLRPAEISSKSPSERRSTPAISEAPSGRGLDGGGALDDEIVERVSDCPATEQPDPDRLRHQALALGPNSNSPPRAGC